MKIPPMLFYLFNQSSIGMVNDLMDVVYERNRMTLLSRSKIIISFSHLT